MEIDPPFSRFLVSGFREHENRVPNEGEDAWISEQVLFLLVIF